MSMYPCITDGASASCLDSSSRPAESSESPKLCTGPRGGEPGRPPPRAMKRCGQEKRHFYSVFISPRSGQGGRPPRLPLPLRYPRRGRDACLPFAAPAAVEDHETIRTRENMVPCLPFAAPAAVSARRPFTPPLTPPSTLSSLVTPPHYLLACPHPTPAPPPALPAAAPSRPRALRHRPGGPSPAPDHAVVTGRDVPETVIRGRDLPETP